MYITYKCIYVSVSLCTDKYVHIKIRTLKHRRPHSKKQTLHIEFAVLTCRVLPTLTYQNLQKSRVPINSILGFIIRTYIKVGFGRLR